MFVFFFKQKTAYEMRISDWSSDVCSSDLHGKPEQRQQALVLLKAALQAGHAVIRKRFEAGTPALATRQSIAFLTDQIIRLVFDFTVNRVYRLPNPTAAEKLSLMAVGGRSEEHTSELQSLMRISYAVFCLKKKK